MAVDALVCSLICGGGGNNSLDQGASSGSNDEEELCLSVEAVDGAGVGGVRWSLRALEYMVLWEFGVEVRVRAECWSRSSFCWGLYRQSLSLISYFGFLSYPTSIYCLVACWLMIWSNLGEFTQPWLRAQSRPIVYSSSHIISPISTWWFILSLSYSFVLFMFP